VNVEGSLKEQIESLKKEFLKELKQAESTKQIEELRVLYLGKKGPLTSLMQLLKSCTPEDRPLFGQLINQLKVDIDLDLGKSFHKLSEREIQDQINQEKIDISLPGKKSFLGRPHPISQAIDEMLEILISMGFTIYHSPEVESDYYNYGALNYPEDHPARDMQDTYYLDEKTVLRSHTTSFQQRVMESYELPIRMACPGKCYRNEEISTRSHVLFHQIDVMYIDKGVTFGDLLATLEEFYSKLFKEKVEIRVRASYFPFVEPGMEVDVRCTICKGHGCRVCKHSGWLEVCGAGMIHPEVLKAGGIDPDKYSGFAWGGGVERLFLMLRGVSDIRLFLENDLRFLEQFP
jgi:phenylalanyl-tRNA synthetase alpha chain